MSRMVGWIPNDEFRAYHEAGHVVMHFLCWQNGEYQALHATIDREPPDHSGTLWTLPPGDHGGFWHTGPKSEQLAHVAAGLRPQIARKLLTGRLAGDAAVKILRGEGDPNNARGDLWEATKLVEWLVPATDELPTGHAELQSRRTRLLTEMETTTEKQLRTADAWPLVKAVANALLQHRALDGEQLQAVVAVAQEAQRTRRGRRP